jgi:hypothetical protein
MANRQDVDTQNAKQVTPMCQKLLLAFLLVAAVGASLAASDDTPESVSFLPDTSLAWIGAIDAVPEPDSFAMLLASLGLMGLIARRR